MARIRTMKPALFTSRNTSAYTDAQFRTFAGLIVYCDDKGRGEDDVELIKAEIAPRIKRSPGQIEAHLCHFASEKDPPLCRYEADGERYLHLLGFLDHQRINRPTKSKIPPCPIHEPEGFF